MNTRELEQVLDQDEYSYMYAGVFSLDQLPELQKKKIYILNLDKSHQSGSHWVGIQTLEAPNYVTYFDSFGSLPAVEIMSKLLKAGKEIWYSDKPVQSPLSQYCGYHVLMVSLLMARGFSLQEILIHGYQAEDEAYLRNDFVSVLIIRSMTSLKDRPIINWSQFF